MPAAVRYLALAALLAGVPVSMRAQSLACEAGDLEVVRLTFDGNQAFSSNTLEDGIVTTPSSWTRRMLHVFGTRRCLNRPQFTLDVLRLLVWYRNHGYTQATVDTVLRPMGKGRIGIHFSVHEGAPLIVDSLAIEGLGTVPEREAVLRGLPIHAGRPFDKYANEQTRETLTRRLHNGGYPDAEVFVGYDTRLAERTAAVTMTVVPGPRVHIGAVDVRGSPREGATRAVSDRAVRRVAGLSTGDLYSEQELARAKRALYQTEAFTRVGVVPDSVVSPRDSSVRVTLEVAEGFMRSVRLGGGWGTLDCVRMTGDFTQYDFLGGATRLDLRGRVSKIGVGRPLTGLETVCPQAHSDLYSRDLNYYTGATVTQPALFHEFIPSLALYSERRSEYNAFLRTTPVGGTVALTRLLSRITQSVSYTVEYGRTEAQPALLCAVFNACEEADRASFRRSQLLAVASVAVARETGDDPVNPTRGSAVRFEFRTAGAHTGSDPSLRFNKLLADGALYAPVNGDIVFAARLRFGAVLGPGLSFSNAALFVPQQERLFAGGPTTVRGFRQNELGPAVYIPSGYDTVRADGRRGGDLGNPVDTVYFRARDSVSQRIVPTGGNALMVAMAEARIRSPLLSDLLQWTIFVDAGAVWNRGTPDATPGFKSLRWTPGIGMRLRTLIGSLRLDVAYNPYARPAGAAYFDAPLTAGGALFCVSPGNTLRVTTVADGRVQQATGGCPATFQPPRGSSFLSRLTPSVSIGQAF
ncbi:MAG TPA: BamA/TamA family outer membrane protein [Gemmatimonadaceae bacterium]|nr:BamA/TamA family outer membrane protein [Gemmatimonadaceae bacterium]